MLDATQTNFSFSAYRYSTKDYLSLNDVISLQNSIDSYSDDHDTNRNDAYRNSYSHSKMSFRLTSINLLSSTERITAHSISAALDELLG